MLKSVLMFSSGLTCFLGFSAAAFAQPLCASPECVAPAGSAPSAKSVFETRAYVGLQWNFGDAQPEFLLGARRTETNSQSHVSGGKLELAMPLISKLEQTKPLLRAMAVAGNRDVQAEFGFGMRAFDWRPLVAAGVQAPYANGGLNYVFGDGLKPYVGLNSLSRPAAPRKSAGALTCPPGYSLSSLSSLAPFQVAPSAVVDSQTCVSS